MTEETIKKALEKRVRDDYMRRVFLGVSVFCVVVLSAALCVITFGFPADRQIDTECYMELYESGTITDEYVSGGFLYVEFNQEYINELESNSKSRKVYFPDEMSLLGTGDGIELRWCYIQYLNSYRIRGAWRV